MAELLADEDFSHPVVSGLQRLGHDILTVRDLGRANQRWPDHELFFFALAQHRAILTKNRRHFYNLHEQYPNHFGIIACTEDPDFAGAVGRIDQILSRSIPLNGKFLRVYQS